MAQILKQILPVQVIERLMEECKMTAQELLDEMQTMVENPDSLAVVHTAQDVLDNLEFMTGLGIQGTENLEVWLRENPEQADQLGMSSLISAMKYGEEFDL
jgi:hypothetical protein